VNNESHDLIWS